MTSFLKVGSWVINESRIAAIEFAQFVDVYGDAGEVVATFPAESAEGRALAWYFLDHDRSVLRIPGVTADVVDLHASHLEAVAASIRPRVATAGRDEVYARDVRNHLGYPAAMGKGGAA